MEMNFTCSLCRREAEQCCLCSPLRVYLCTDCISKHTSSQQVCHSIVPAATSPSVTPGNVGEYNRRHAVLNPLKLHLETVSAQLQQERSELKRIYTEVYDIQLQQLYEIMAATYRDISEYYDRLQTEIDTFKKEVTQAMQYVPVSAKTWKYVEKGLHLPQSCVFLDLQEEFTARVQVLSTGRPLPKSALSTWISRCTPCACVCRECTEVMKTLLWQSKLTLCPACSQSLPSSGICDYCTTLTYSKAEAKHWSCRYCGEAKQTETVCTTCGHAQDDVKWSCFGCGETNSGQLSICNSCDASKELWLYLVLVGVDMTDSSRKWKCACGGETPVYMARCGKCKAENAEVKKAMEFRGRPLSSWQSLKNKCGWRS